MEAVAVVNVFLLLIVQLKLAIEIVGGVERQGGRGSHAGRGRAVAAAAATAVVAIAIAAAAAAAVGHAPAAALGLPPRGGALRECVEREN